MWTLSGDKSGAQALSREEALRLLSEPSDVEQRLARAQRELRGWPR